MPDALPPSHKPGEHFTEMRERGAQLPARQGDKPQWQHNQDYRTEKTPFPAIGLQDAAFIHR